ncbi:Uncharacterised protein g10967 [Pycnogonum litorale]
MHVAEKMMFLIFVLVSLKIKASVAGPPNGGACPCQKKCGDDGGTFNLENAKRGPKKYCISRTCTVEGFTGVCRLSCDSGASLCIRNVTNCTALNPNAYCSISKPVRCSTANGDGRCSDVCSCDPQTSDVSRTDLCTSLDKNAVCCSPKSDDDDEIPFTRANISDISRCVVTRFFNGVESASCCQNLCSLEESCKAFALFKDRETGSQLCQLMKEATLCSQPTLFSQLDLIDYFEKPELKIRNIGQFSHRSDPRPASETWRRDCWSPECPISAAIGFRDDGGSVDNEIDYIKCGLYNSDMVLLTADAERMDVTSEQASRCKPNYLLTAIHDNGAYWSSPDHYKCLKLANWRTVDQNCTQETSLSLEEYTCPMSEGIPTYVVGIARSSRRGIQAITCCPVEKI